jgi:SSS family solute:Na+ symporter
MSTLVTSVPLLKTDTSVNGVALTVLIILFLLVTALGFMATRFKAGEHLNSLDEWGLGGRRFGTWIT